MKRTVAAMLFVALGFSVSACEELETGSGSKASNGGKNLPKNMTSAQENALRSGQNYIDSMPFSKAGLVQQLSSQAGEGYAKKDAVFAANHVDANWKAEAVEAAKNYMDTMPMSKDGLIKQLSSSAGDKYTKAEATYAANKVY